MMKAEQHRQALPGRSGLFLFVLGWLLLMSGCASPYKRVQIGDPALPASTLAGGRWEHDGLAYLTRILAIDGTPTRVQDSIWKDVDAKTDFTLPAGRHVLSIEVREHSTFNEACRAYGGAEVEVILETGRRYYLRSTIRDNVATVELMDLSTFEAAATFPAIPLKRGVLGFPVKL